MRIKSYESSRFAGLRDMKIEFEEGLNVILGDNESGKSTIINGIHSTLFKNIRLRKSYNADINFASKFMPHPTGDSIDGKVIIETKEGKHEIYKEWGSSEAIIYRDSDGSVFKNEKDINEELFKLLGYGESTYSNIVFAKQEDLKTALRDIIGNSELTDEISDILRKTMMELEGISIDKIQKDIEREIENLYKRWDRDKNYPQNNKGINNPYKAGLGIILESYYKKENLFLTMEETEKTEKEFEDICKRMEGLEEKIGPLREKKSELEKIEEDVNNRALLEMEISSIEKDLEALVAANKNWPRSELLLEQYEEKLKDVRDDKKKLNEEKDNIEKENKRKVLEKKLAKIEEIDEKLEKILEDISKLSKIDDDDIENLRKLQGEILKLETTMQASKMIGVLNKKGLEDLYIARDFGEREKLQVEEPFEANGVIKISYKDDFEIEIKTGDRDYEELNNKYSSSKKAFEELLEKLKVDTLEKAILCLEKIKSLEEDKKTLKDQRGYILEDITKEELQSKVDKLSHVKVSRDLEIIKELLEKNSDKELDILSKQRSEEEKIKAWKEEYKDADSLLLELVDRKGKLKVKQEEEEKLKPLPEEFKTAGDFRKTLNHTREELKRNEDELENIQPLFYEAKNNLSDTSYEEVEKEYREAKKRFDANLKKGETFLEIQRVFLETKEELSNNPMETLVNEFTRLLEIITHGTYKQGEIDEEFNIRLENINGEISIDLLSAGTYDSVTLALRFALLKHIFPEEGYVVLDDSLVDLDPARKKESIKLINEFSKDYQIIFTTCDPETAHMLGGNIIEI